MAYEAECPDCGGTILYHVTPGEARTWDYPGSGPEIDVVGGDCECPHSEELVDLLLDNAADEDEAAYDAYMDMKFEEYRERKMGWD